MRKSPRGPNRYADTIRIEDRKQNAFKLRCQGYSVMDIAAELGYSPSVVSMDLKAAVNEYRGITAADAETCRQFELQRLDTMLKALQVKIEEGDVPAICAGLKIVERRCKMLGIDSPTEVQLTEQPNAQLARAKLLELLTKG
jgi:predicted transcriptional regulator